MARSVRYGLSCLVLITGCAGARSSRVDEGAAPGLSVSPLRRDAATGTLRALGSRELLGATEEATIELRVDRPAYVSAVLFAPAGTSEDLLGPGGILLWPEQPRYIRVPRRAPPVVKETELPLFFVASTKQTPSAIYQLLRLPCKGPGRRGDPEPERPREPRKDPPKEQPKTEKDPKKAEGGSGKPPEGDDLPRGGSTFASACPDAVGLTSPVTVRALVLRSE